jgi:hypothetical protein
LGLFFAGAARGDVTLPRMFSDHMVLQRDVPLAVWGWAERGEKVRVEIAGRFQTTVADAAGKWRVTLPALSASREAASLTVTGRTVIVVRDVLVGDVWLCSGQSNMETRVFRAHGYEAEKAQADLPRMRMFSVQRAAKAEPQAECNGRWEVTTAQSFGNFSAIAYYFGSALHRSLDVPIGLIKSAWGSTGIEAWTSVEAQRGILPGDGTADRERILNENTPGGLFNGMIAPLAPYGLRGVVWYQGEANSRRKHAALYSVQLAAMINDWRGRWQSALPFVWVQLPEYRAPQTQPVEPSGWVTIREQMRQTLRVPGTGMVVALGYGDENEIHPKAKRGVAERIAAWALSEVYRLPGRVGSGPVFVRADFEDGRAKLSFDHTHGGLVAKGGVLKGFAIAGADRVWRWASASIENDRVVVSHPAIARPAAVRYAWAENPQFSLWNGAGLPAGPFRTDDWVDSVDDPATPRPSTAPR